MVLVLILYSVLITALEFPQENKSEKINACIALAKQKLLVNPEALDLFFNKFKTPKLVKDYYTADMVLKCYKEISLETAENLLSQANNIIITEILENLINIDTSSYKEGIFKSNQDHISLRQEINDIKNLEKLKKLESKEKSDLNKNTPPLFNASPYYIISVILISIIFIYYAIHHVLLKPIPQKHKSKKKN
ncbi:hypothetical protein SteCoe_22038 [Stentor coeruleus]|uniref:Uncharacterized protein n=1 Tax=Stentor coeruleus TaxID=5963 RepID=A0A1R2BN47_9CILI|nr:hypothetical protein SteCoe_22038 [Stentor coeruleus]